MKEQEEASEIVDATCQVEEKRVRKRERKQEVLTMVVVKGNPWQSDRVVCVKSSRVPSSNDDDLAYMSRHVEWTIDLSEHNNNSSLNHQ